MNKEPNRYREVLERIQRGIMCFTSAEISGIVEEALNPKPQTETVEVKRWEVINRKGESCWVCKSFDEAQNRATDNCNIVELHGTYQREVKSKAKRREDITDYKNHGGGTHIHVPYDACNIPTKARIYAEWFEE